MRADLLWAVWAVCQDCRCCVPPVWLLLFGMVILYHRYMVVSTLLTIVYTYIV